MTDNYILVLEEEIKECLDTINWFEEKISLRLLDEDRGIINALRDSKIKTEEYLDRIQNEYFKKTRTI